MSYRKQEISAGTAYILWIFGFFGIFGVHRFYLGKVGSGLLYLFTFGLFGFGQFIDLFLIPGMTRERNYYLLQKSTVESLSNIVNGSPVTLQQTTENPSPEFPANSHHASVAEPKPDPMLTLLKAAAANNNVLSIGQAVIVTELPVEEVEKLLQKAIKQNLAHIDNDLQTGAIRYHFDI